MRLAVCLQACSTPSTQHISDTHVFGVTSQAVTGAVTHHLAYQAQSLLQSFGLGGSGSSTGSSSGEKKQTPFENLSRNASAELANRLQEALAVYTR